MKRVALGCLRVVRAGARRAWDMRLAATAATIGLQLIGLFLVAVAGWMVYRPLGLFVGGVLLVWLGNGLQPEPKPEPGDA